jgi:hypothetical protein
MRYRTLRLIVALSVVLSLKSPVSAQAPEAIPPGAQLHPPFLPMSSISALRDGLPPMEEVTRDLKRADGLFTIFYADSQDHSRDAERLLALIPSRILNQDLLLATSLSQGGYFTGWMWDDYLIRFEVRGKQVAIVIPEVRYPGNPVNPVTEMVQKTYNSRILATASVLTFTPGGDPIIDLGSLLKSNLAGLPSGGGIRSDLSKWVRRPGFPKVFPDNVLIEVELAVSRGQGANLLGVAYAFRSLPSGGGSGPPFNPRVADDRVGYFLTARRDWTKKHDARDTFDRFINRWNLQKKDPSLDLSPPVKPITFIIEKTVPVQWRRSVRQGIEVWNKAFEKIGFTDAIQVLQQTNDNDLKDIDPEDARYNFFRWIVSGNPFAMGPSRTDPRTGEILDADIIFDDSMVRYWIEDFLTFTPRHVAEAKGPGFREYLKRHPSLKLPHWEGPEPDRVSSEGYDEARKLVEEKFAERGQSFCDLSVGFQHQLSVGYYALAVSSGNPQIPEKLIGEAIRETVAHEVGHALGLRHNFKASSWLSLEEIQNRRMTDEPTSGSVMDYNALLFSQKDSADSQGHFITPTIGPYDYWAIEYGYKVPGPKDGPEPEMLKKISSRCAEPGLAYATDEDTMWVYSPDPLVNRFDMSSDPFRWASERIKLVDGLIARVAEMAAAPGESRYFITRAFDSLLFEKATVLDVVSRWIGGQYFYRDHQGDPAARPPFVLVPAEKQREAMKLLKDTIYQDTFFTFSPALLNQLAPPRWMHWGASTSLRLDYPIHRRILLLQWWNLTDLLSSPILQRVYDAELKCPDSDKFSVSELLTSLRDAVWAGLEKGTSGVEFTDAHPYLSSISRSLQRQHMELLVEGVLSPAADGDLPPDLHAIICGSARELSERIGKVLSGDQKVLDSASRGHLIECRSRLNRALEAQFQRQG